MTARINAKGQLGIFKKEPQGKKRLLVPKVKKIARWLFEKKGIDIRAIDLRGLCSVTEAMVVVTAQNIRHAKALADFTLDQAGQERYDYLGMEGYAQGLWVLLDLNDVLVHIFQADERELYDLEGLWAEGKTICALETQEES